MSPAFRKLLLTAHVVVSVGWLGAVLAFLVLAVIGVTHGDAATVRGVYRVMQPAAQFALVPLSIASLVVGVVQALGTPWGLLRHYWVVFKLLINVVSVVVLLTYLSTFQAMADTAADPVATLADVRDPSPVLHAAAALVLLLVATTLSVYKPKGLTPRGQRGQRNGEPIPAG